MVNMTRLSVAALLALAALALWWAAMVSGRRREAPGADLFALSAAVAGANALALAISLALALPQAVIIASTVVVALVLPVPWLLFSFEYTGRNEVLSLGVASTVVAVPGVGLVATALIFGSQLLPFFTLPSREAASGLTEILLVLIGMIQWFSLLYAGGLMLVGSAVLLWTFHRYEHLDSTSGTLLGIFGTIPWLSTLFGLRVSGIELLALPGIVSVGFFTGAVAVSGSLGYYHLFSSVPAAGNVGPATVLEELEDVMIVTDDEETIVEVNAAAERALDATAAGIVGGDVEAAFDVSLPELQETASVSLQSADGRALYEPTVSKLTDQHGHQIGHAIVLRDVTVRTTRQQRLKVLNRVLRHNLRNDLNVINSSAELVRRKVNDPALVNSAQRVIDNARGLSRLSEEARELDQLMGNAGSPSETVSLTPLAERVVEEILADAREVNYDVDISERVIVEGSEELLELALRNVVENAVEHNESNDPYVELRVDYDADRTYPVTLSVLDNGPGIPEHEKRVIEQGHETSLQHGSSLGLWAVHWVITRVGGEIDFDRRDPHGTIVSLRLPGERRSQVETVTTPDPVRQ
jgi:signal transduction histidine kinase